MLTITIPKTVSSIGVSRLIDYYSNGNQDACVVCGCIRPPYSFIIEYTPSNTNPCNYDSFDVCSEDCFSEAKVALFVLAEEAGLPIEFS